LISAFSHSLGQNRKSSRRANVFRFTLNNRHRQAAPDYCRSPAPLIASSIGGAVLLFAPKLD
jgi:hypothetical protein